MHLVSVLLAASGCQGSGGGPNPDGIGSGDSVCPQCLPWAGGETSDFGGTPFSCDRVSEQNEIEIAEAESAGIGVARLLSRLETTIELPLRWEVAHIETGPSASGFETSTNIVIQHRIVGSVLRVKSASDDYCDETTCSRGETTVQRASCESEVAFDVQAEVQTTDGAIQAQLNGIAVAKRRGGVFDEASVGLAIDLREALGSLGVHPSESFGQYTGVLRLMSEFSPNHVSGVVWVDLVSETRRFLPMVPIQGVWSDE